MDTFTFIVAILLLLFVVSDVAAAWLLVKTTARSNYSLIALNERAFVATIQAVSGSLLALLGANRIWDWHLAEPIVLIVLTIAVLLQATPSLIWLYLFLRHKFEPKGIRPPKVK